jgi:hypothetical protein
LERIVDQLLIDQIVKKALDLLLEKMIAAAPKQQVLVLFSGAGTGYVVGMQAVQWLAKADHPLTVILTASARQIVGEENVRKAGAARVIGDHEWVNTPQLVREADLVLMPTLSMNTAAHLALGLMDSLVTTLTLGSLLAGKPVLAVCDGANPYGNGGRVFGDAPDTAPLLRTKLADNLTTLMGFGIHLVKEDAFLLSLAKYLNNAARQTDSPQLPPAGSVLPNTPPNIIATAGPGMLLTASDVLVYPPGSTLRLTSGAKLTPLAQEVAARQRLNLVYA